VFAVLLWQDPHAANDSGVLLARSVYADGSVYLPHLHIRTWTDGAPGLAARVLAWLAVTALAALWTARAARGRGGLSPLRALAGTAAVVLACGFGLEQWPGPSRASAPRFPNRLELGGERSAFLSGPATVRDGEALLRGGTVRLRVRSGQPTPSLRWIAGGRGRLRWAGAAPVMVRPAGVAVDLPLRPVAEIAGAAGGRIFFQEAVLETEGELLLRPVDRPEGTPLRGDPGEPPAPEVRS
jgi:hypothetical protein